MTWLGSRLQWDRLRQADISTTTDSFTDNGAFNDSDSPAGATKQDANVEVTNLGSTDQFTGTETLTIHNVYANGQTEDGTQTITDTENAHDNSVENDDITANDVPGNNQDANTDTTTDDQADITQQTTTDNVTFHDPGSAIAPHFTATLTETLSTDAAGNTTLQSATLDVNGSYTDDAGNAANVLIHTTSADGTNFNTNVAQTGTNLFANLNVAVDASGPWLDNSLSQLDTTIQNGAPSPQVASVAPAWQAYSTLLTGPSTGNAVVNGAVYRGEAVVVSDLVNRGEAVEIHLCAGELTPAEAHNLIRDVLNNVRPRADLGQVTEQQLQRQIAQYQGVIRTPPRGSPYPAELYQEYNQARINFLRTGTGRGPGSIYQFAEQWLARQSPAWLSRNAALARRLLDTLAREQAMVAARVARAAAAARAAARRATASRIGSRMLGIGRFALGPIGMVIFEFFDPTPTAGVASRPTNTLMFPDSSPEVYYLPQGTYVMPNGLIYIPGPESTFIPPAGSFVVTGPVSGQDILYRLEATLRSRQGLTPVNPQP